MKKSEFWSPVSRIVPKNVKGWPLGVFEHPFFCKIATNEALQCTGKLFCCFRGIRDTKIEKSRGTQDKISL